MSKTTKIWLIIAAAFLLTGGLVLGSTIVMLKGDVLELSTIRYETNTYEINHVFENISINNDTADVVFVPSGNGKCSVVCYEQTNLKHTVTVKDNTLTIDVLDTRNWYDYIGINFSAPKTTVYLAVGVYGELFVETDTAFIRTDSRVELNSITCVCLNLPVIIHPSHLECKDTLRLYNTLDDLRILEFRMLVVNFFN